MWNKIKQIFTNNNSQISPGGSKIYNHKKISSRNKFEITNTEENIKIRTKYYESLFGKDYNVFHEEMPLNPHIDVYSFAPDTNRDYRVLITGGMSDKDLNAPKELKDYSREEIVFLVRENTYQLNKDRVANLARVYAGFPHEVNSFLFNGHTVESYTKPQSLFPEFEDRFKYVLFLLALPIEGMPESTFQNLIIDSYNVKFLYVIPITEEEYYLKMEKGTDSLLDLWEEKGEIPLVFDHLR